MQIENDNLRDRLLGQQSPRTDKLAEYRKEVQAMLDQNEYGLRRERRYTTILWIFIVMMCTGFMIIGGLHPTTVLGVWFGVLACFWLIYGSVELLKHFINRGRVDVLKELKQLELRVVELQEMMKGKS